MKKSIRLLAWIPAIIAAVMITGFSSQNGSESSGLSRKAAIVVINVVDSVRKTQPDTLDKEQRIERIQYPIRKGAHMTEYAVFTMTVYFALTINGFTDKKRCVMAVGLAFLLAGSDELHQLFVPGRSGRFTDVLIDTAGSLIGLAICGGVRRMAYDFRKRVIDKAVN